MFDGRQPTDFHLGLGSAVAGYRGTDQESIKTYLHHLPQKKKAKVTKPFCCVN